MQLKETIKLYQLSLEGGSHTPATRKIYLDTLDGMLDAVGDIELKAVTIWPLRHWQANINSRVENEELSVWSLHQYTRSVHRFFRWCVEERLLEYSPADRLPLPKLPEGEEPKNISDADLERMLQTAFATSRRDYAIVRFLADTGCRRGGAVALTIPDMRLNQLEATVREKGYKARTVYFDQETANALRTYVVIRPRGRGDAFFLGRQGPLSGAGIRQVLRRLKERGSIEGRANAHAFRHAWARRALETGMDLGRVSKLLGHTDIRVTHQFYACWTQKELKDSHRKHNTMEKFRITA